MQLTVLDKICVLLNSSRLLNPRPWPTDATALWSSTMPSDCAYSATAPRVRQFQNVKLELNMALGAEHASTQSLQPSPARIPFPALELVKQPVSRSEMGGGRNDPLACDAADAAVSLSCDMMEPNDVVLRTTWNADRPNRGTKLSSSGPTSSRRTAAEDDELLAEAVAVAVLAVVDSNGDPALEAGPGPAFDPPAAPPGSAIVGEGLALPRLMDARRNEPDLPRPVMSCVLCGGEWFEKSGCG